MLIRGGHASGGLSTIDRTEAEAYSYAYLDSV
jgi:hypothetical protein